MNPKKTVAVIFSSTRIGGVELKVLSLLRILQTEYRVVAICLEGIGPLHDEYVSSGAELFILHRKNRYNPLIIFKIIRILRREKVVLAQTFLSGNYWGRVASILAQVPVIIASEDSLRTWQTPFQRFVFKMLLTGNSKVLCNSFATRDVTSHMTGIAAENFDVIWNGFDAPRTFPTTQLIKYVQNRQQKGKNNKFKILSVGRLDHRKGYMTIIESLASLISNGISNFHYTIVGEGDLRDELMTLISYYNLGSHVELVGAQTNLDEYYREADIFIHFPTEEGFGIVILEALYYGLPIIASRVGGISEIMNFQGCGMLIEPNSKIAITQSLEQYLASGEILNHDPLSCRKRSQGFLWQNIGQEYIKYYESLI